MSQEKRRLEKIIHACDKLKQETVSKVSLQPFGELGRYKDTLRALRRDLAEVKKKRQDETMGKRRSEVEKKISALHQVCQKLGVQTHRAARFLHYRISRWLTRIFSLRRTYRIVSTTRSCRWALYTRRWRERARKTRSSSTSPGTTSSRRGCSSRAACCRQVPTLIMLNQI